MPRKSTARKNKPGHHEKPWHSQPGRARDTATATAAAKKNTRRTQFNPVVLSDDTKLEDRRYRLQTRLHALMLPRWAVGYTAAKAYFDDPDVQVTRVK